MPSVGEQETWCTACAAPRPTTCGECCRSCSTLLMLAAVLTAAAVGADQLRTCSCAQGGYACARATCRVGSHSQRQQQDECSPVYSCEQQPNILTRSCMLQASEYSLCIQLPTSWPFMFCPELQFSCSQAWDLGSCPISECQGNLVSVSTSSNLFKSGQSCPHDCCSTSCTACALACKCRIVAWACS